MTDVFALFGRGVLLTAPLQTRAPALACRQAVPAPRSGLHIAEEDLPRPRLRQRRRPRTSEPRPGSDFDRCRGAWRAHAGSRRPGIPERLGADAVRAVLGHGLPSFESPARWSILAGPTVRPKGPTP